MRLLTHILLSIMMLIVCVAWAEEQEAGMDVEIPEISNEARALFLKGVWWDLYPPLLPEIEEMRKIWEEGLDVPLSLVDDQPIVDVLPEDNKTIPEQYLPEYIRQAVAGLIDPQKILPETEHHDVVALIAALERYSSIKIYVSMFVPGQDVPPSVNAPALARQIFKEGERSMLLHVHYGQVMTMQVVCDQKWTEKLGDKGRRALTAKVKETASVYTNAHDSLMEAIAAMVVYAEPVMNASLQDDDNKGSAITDVVPLVNITIEETEKERKSGLSDKIKEWTNEAQSYVSYMLAFLGAIVLIVGLAYWRRNVAPIKLARIEPDVRLGAPYGAGVSRVVSYGGREDSNPESLSRRQMRDHLKDIT